MSSQRLPRELHTFQGMLLPTTSSKELLNSLDSFDARGDDVFLVSYPKSGTHWVAEIIENIPSARITLTPPIELGDISRLEELNMYSGRRVIPTHLSYNLLPLNVKQKQCKIKRAKLRQVKVFLIHHTEDATWRYSMALWDLDSLLAKPPMGLACPLSLRAELLGAAAQAAFLAQIIYIVRNPKDTAVSLFHYYRDNPHLPSVETWAAFLELFLQGDVVYGSWFDHVLSWEEHKNDKNVLIIFYEEMKKDLPKNIKKITTFLGINVSDSDINKIAWKASFNEMKTNAVKENCDPNHTICALTSNRSLVFRKGVVGDWLNYFTPRQKKAFDALFTEKMKHSELARRLQEYST